MNRTTVASLGAKLLAIVNRVLTPLGVLLVRRSQLSALAASTGSPDTESAPDIPEHARDYLVPSNPRLLELRRRYADHPATTASRWSREFVEREVGLGAFRADNPYVWSSRDAYVDAGGRKVRVATQAVNYVLTAYYARQHDAVGVLAKAREDGLFGIRRFRVDEDLTVSRDLLDSTLELNFLERHLEISTRAHLTVLDVGAGYGRFAHRLLETFPNVRVCCTDAVPESTFLSEFYLRFRGVHERATVIALDELDSLAPGQVDLAVNIHSWSECPLEVIDWWLELLAGLGVAYLMVVPNDGERLLSLEPDGAQRDFAPLLSARGYRPVTVEPKYGSSACQRLGVYPTHYHLFARERVI